MSQLVFLEEVITHVSNNPGAAATARGIAKQAGCAAGGAIIGGVVLGPLGAMAGGVVGSGVGFAITDPYQNIFELARDLTDEQKRALVQTIVGAVGTMSLVEFISWYRADNNPKALETMFVAALALAQVPAQ